jgi:uncharacterized membrane protein SpoIIM required for sporulation
MKTISENFVYYRKDRWKRLREIVLSLARQSGAFLSEDAAREFPRLYRQACADLAEARMLKLSRDVTGYLNNLVGQAHKQLYSLPVVKTSRIGEFFTRDMPSAFGRFKVYIAVAAAIFLIPMISSFIVVYNNPGIANTIVDESLLSMMESSYRTEISGDRVWSMNATALSFYIQHNISIAFISFAAGILAGLGTVYFLVTNGLVLGTIGGYITSLGYGANFLRFVCAHSVFELTGLVFSGAAGLMLGYCIIRAARHTRRDELNLQKENILLLIGPAVFMIAIAACIEGFVSPSSLSMAGRVVIALASLAGLTAYFAFGSRRRTNK